MLARHIAPALALLALAACSNDPTGPDPAPDSPLLAALEVSAEPSATRVGRGEWLPVTVRVVNRSDRAITVVGSGSCGVRLEVRDTESKLAGQSAKEVCTRDCRSYVFAPGQAVVRETRFNARFFDIDAQRERSLPAGEYQLAGRVDGTLDTCGGTPAQTTGTAARVRVL